MKAGRRRLAPALCAAAAALLLTAAPYGIDAHGFSPQAAAAAPGSNGSPGGSNSGGGNPGKSGNDKSGSGNSAGGNGDSDNKERGSETSPGSAPGPASVEQRRATPDSGRRKNEHVNPETGTTIEVNGSNVEVLHRDGISEEITNGRYRMNDAQGRLIIERIATESDRARFRAMVR